MVICLWYQSKNNIRLYKTTSLHVLLFLFLCSDLLHWSNLQQTSMNKLHQRWFKSHPYSLVWWRWLTIMHLNCWMRFRQMFLASGSFHNNEPLNRWWNHTNRGDSNWEGCGERRSPPTLGVWTSNYYLYFYVWILHLSIICTLPNIHRC